MLPGLASVAGLVSAPKSFSYQELKTDTVARTTYTFSAADLGAAEAGRVIIVGITAPGNNAKTISSVTIGGVSASILVQISNGFWCVGIAAAVVPTGATGDVVVALSAQASVSSAAIYRATGLTGVTAIDTDSNTTLSGLTLTTDPSGFVVAVASDANARTYTWTGATENYDTILSGVISITGASGATPGNSVTVTPTPSGAVTQEVFVAACF